MEVHVTETQVRKFSVSEWYGPEPLTRLAHPLTKLAGQFAFHGKVWPNEDNLDEVYEAAGTAQGRLVADGRFLLIEWDSVVLGHKWSGIHLFGYDSGHSSAQGYRGIKEVHCNSLGNFGVGKTDYNGSDARVEIHGETHECSRGVEKYRTVVTVVDNNSFRLEVHMTDRRGTESLARHFTYTRL